MKFIFFIKLNSVFAIILLITNGCGIKTEFNKDDLKWLGIYNEGDSLIFKSDCEKTDTFLIVNKENFYPGYNPIELHDIYLPQMGKLWISNTKDNTSKWELLEISKDSPNKTSVYISFKSFGVLLKNTKSINLKKLKKDKIYIFESSYRKDHIPTSLYWHEEYGLVKYILGDNSIWVRTNINDYLIKKIENY
jgi:hypothetical protein